MKFVNTDNLKNKVKGFSKSALDKYDKCPLWAYKDFRSTKKQSSSRQLEIGILAHEIAAKKLADKVGIKREVFDIIERFPLDVIFEVEEEIFKYTNFDYLYNGMEVLGVEESISFEVSKVREGFRFNGRFDVVSYLTINNQKYVVVDDFKSGFQISKKVDNEALIYAFAAYKQYNLPVIFRRIGLRNGKTWEHEFSIQTLKNMEDRIIFKVKYWKEEMEGELTPEYTPGSHCLYCPYLTKCQGRKDISNMNKKFKASIWAKQYAKVMEAEVKAAAAEVMSHAEIPEVGSESILLPFLGNRYGAVAKTSESYGLKGRKLKKSDIIKLLIDTGEIDNFIDTLDIKFSAELSEKLNDVFKIPMKKTVRTAISLVEVFNEEDEDNE